MTTSSGQATGSLQSAMKLLSALCGASQEAHARYEQENSLAILLGAAAHGQRGVESHNAARRRVLELGTLVLAVTSEGLRISNGACYGGVCDCSPNPLTAQVLLNIPINSVFHRSRVVWFIVLAGVTHDQAWFSLMDLTPSLASSAASGVNFVLSRLQPRERFLPVVSQRESWS